MSSALLSAPAIVMRADSADDKPTTRVRGPQSTLTRNVAKRVSPPPPPPPLLPPSMVAEGLLPPPQPVDTTATDPSNSTAAANQE